MKENRLFLVRLFSATLLILHVVAEESLTHEIPVPVAPEDARTALPAFTAAHAVGVRSFYWVDDTRSKTGMAGEGGEREITVTVWYPARTRAGQMHALYAPGVRAILAAVAKVPEDRRQFIMAHEPLLDVATSSVPGADPEPTNEGWPVIFFSPGGNVSHQFQTALAERIAGHGFVFVAMSHPYSSLDVAPVSGFSMSLDWGLDDDDRKLANENDNRLADILAGDAHVVFKQMQALAKQGDALGAVMDLKRAGIMGHSRGGKTVGRSCSNNAEFRACVVIDNIGPAAERITGVERPMLTLRSEWGEDRVAELHDFLGRTGSISFDVVLENSNHFSCTDLPFFIPELRAEGTKPVDGIDQCATIIAGFFDAFLSGGRPTRAEWAPDSSTGGISVRRFTSKE